jgi:rod shape-determining protein MreD
MKKLITIISFFITFLIIYFLQSNFFSWFTIAGVKPNLFIILVLFISLFTETKYGIVCGAFMGFFLDIVIGKQIGPYTLSLTAVAFLGGYFDKNFSKDSKLTMMLIVMLSTVLFEIISYVFNIIQSSINVEIISFTRILIIEIIYNMFITVIVYPIVQKIGYIIEEIYKGQNILTRYF